MPEPITCKLCDQPATVFVSYVHQGKLTKVGYCQFHAEQEGILDPKAYSLLAGSEEAAPEPADDSMRCPNCGCSQRDFERSGRLGCPECYRTFAGVIQPMLKRMHRDERHLGKVPTHRLSSELLQQRMARAKEELQEAIREEQYETAARLRDEISDMQGQLERLEGSAAKS
ncbi:MAG: UvrB/UvrC motif-containing protein [Opitutales bacterium]